MKLNNLLLKLIKKINKNKKINKKNFKFKN